jgi:outer membrane lipoprotein-sorting protein
MKHVFLTLTVFLISLSVYAQTPEEKGLAIAQDADKYDSGFQDFTADMVMTLRNKQGKESTRQIRIRTLEVQGDGDKSMSIFDQPRDVKGTAMLTFSHGLEPDDQWLYLPALKRVKRINSRNKSGPFMGSEFAYEDLSSQEVEKYTYKYLRDEACGELQCYVIEQYPQYEHSGYTRRIVWLDKEGYRPVKVVFYDRKNSLLKTLSNSNYKQYLDHYWRPGLMEMENHQTGKSTSLEWSNYQFRVGLGENDFNKARLKNIR